ncbi:MAG: tetratricopeptide repeat protein [Actinomycetota bacterium]|nr:tetratricopeptide repeat protein [Actinomycetota bacterium]MDH5223643.1 tetratricopeptide repeat protein [Actinomycetota bacterium]MDH5312389.1 tetratricopeptide repeat protein [Actinomycetota bacterium]
MVDMGEMAAATHVVDVTDADFERVVVEGSMQRPVVVDMWASWCAPCRTLGPTLEKVAGERGGAFLLAKLDVDANAVGNALLQAVQSQGIPTVVAFSGGQPVNMFIGAYPEEEVNRFIDEILPTEAEVVTEEAQAVESSGDLESAESGYRAALAKDPTNAEAAVGLARILVRRGDVEEGRALAEPLLPDPDAARVMAVVRVHEWASMAGEGPIWEARRAASDGRWREALDGFLAAFDSDPDAARESMVDVFDTLEDDPLVKEYRPKLAARLF